MFSFECRLLVETAGDARDLAPAILKATTAVDRNLPIRRHHAAQPHAATSLPGADHGVAAAGAEHFGRVPGGGGPVLHGRLAVSRSTHEIGARMALGAPRNDVMWLVLLQGLGLSAAGAAIGLAGMAAASRLISQFVYGITAHDPRVTRSAHWLPSGWPCWRRTSRHGGR